MKKDKNVIHVLIAEIKNDMRVIDKILEEISILRDGLDDQNKVIAAGYHLHNLYSAFEHVFERVAKVFENSLEDKSKYHIQLLNRMAIDIDGIRPKLLSTENYKILNELRAFRHVFRYSYDFELDADKILLLIKKLDNLNYKDDFDNFISIVNISD